MTQPTQHTLIQQQRKALQDFVQANAARKTREAEIATQAQQKHAVVESEYKALSQRNQSKLAETQAMLTLSGTAKTVLDGVMAAPLLTLPNPMGKNAQTEYEQAVSETATQLEGMKTAIANLDSYRAAEAKRQREEVEAAERRRREEEAARRTAEAEAERRRLQKEAQRDKSKRRLQTTGWITAGVAVVAGMYYYPQYQEQQRQAAVAAAAQATKAAATAAVQATQVAVAATATAIAQATQTAGASVRQANPPRRISADRVALRLAPEVEVEFVRIPAGEFSMGSDNGGNDEKPRHKVMLGEYWMGKTEVTNAQFAAFVKATGYKTEAEVNNAQKQNHPVVNVSWNDAVAYTRWVSLVTGQNVRLPSEAEWEKAACGTDGRTYPWGNAAPDRNRVNFDNNVKTTTPVGQYGGSGASPYGLDDMAGNVWEWTSSLYKSYPYNSVDGREDILNTGGRVVRGGSFYDNEGALPCAYRLNSNPPDRFISYGFRLLASPIS